MSPTTVTTYRTRLRDYVSPALDRRKLSQLGRGDVLRVIDACHAGGLSDWAVHGVLTALRAVLRFARERDYMSADPFLRVPRDRLPAQRARTETRALRPDEAALVLDKLRRKKPASVGRRDYVLGCLLVDAGLRVSEACGLTWGDVELVAGLLHVRGQLAPLKAGEVPRIVPPKSHRGYRTMRLLPRLQAALEDLYAGEDDAVFVLRTRTGMPLSRHNAGRSIVGAGKAAGLGEHIAPHVLRRTLGTALSDAGVPVASAAAIMGHSVEVNHDAYVKARRDALEREQARKALMKLGLGVTPNAKRHRVTPT
jgi:integrase